MAYNSDDETLNNPINPQPEKLSNEIISENEADTVILKQETKNMEVHKHPHHIMHKKKWNEYLLEFFMLFLAVFLGFIAENIREGIVDRHREKEYVHSLINDLRTDTAKLNSNLARFQKILLMQDTAIETFASLDKGYNQTYFKNSGGFGGYPDFIYTDATIQQLKNAGGFRLIRSHRAIDSIMHYDGVVKKALINEALLERLFEKTNELTNEIFNQRYFMKVSRISVSTEQLNGEKFDYLLTHDKIALSRYSNQLIYYRTLCEIIIGNMKEVKLSATDLIAFLQNEYNTE